MEMNEGGQSNALKVQLPKCCHGCCQLHFAFEIGLHSAMNGKMVEISYRDGWGTIGYTVVGDRGVQD
jgi:hypothetical protein